MAHIALLSLSGAPGVSTAALAMADAWERPVMVLEADSSRSSSVLPGFFQGTHDHTKGIIHFALAHRRETLDSSHLWKQALEFGPDCWVVPGFTSPAAATSMARVWPQMAELLENLDAAGTDALTDLGRYGAEDRRSDLVKRADAVVLVSGAALPDIAAARAALPPIKEQLRAIGRLENLSLLLVESPTGLQYSSEEISRALALPVSGRIPHDPKNAAVFSHGAERGKRFERSPFARAVRQAASSISGGTSARRGRLAPATLVERSAAGTTSQETDA